MKTQTQHTPTLLADGIQVNSVDFMPFDGDQPHERPNVRCYKYSPDEYCLQIRAIAHRKRQWIASAHLPNDHPIVRALNNYEPMLNALKQVQIIVDAQGGLDRLGVAIAKIIARAEER